MPHLNNFLLSYCTNVHPSEKLDQMRESLTEFTLPLKQRLFPGQDMGLGIWMAAQAAETLNADQDEFESFKQFLSESGFFLFTINAFPYGNFHSTRVKEQVYKPDWTEDSRLDYTRKVADVLARLLPENTSGSISTLSGAYRPGRHDSQTFEAIARNLSMAVAHLHRIENETGKTLMLGIEPEPWTTVELTSETVHFFNEYIYRTGREQLSSELNIGSLESEELLRKHLGLCYDCCHQAVEFEDLGESLETFRSQGIPIAKVHLSCALIVPGPANNPEGIKELLSFDEERYLHQVVAQSNGRNKTLRDLDEFNTATLAEWRNYPEWRCHFHVPIFLEELTNLRTTQPQLRDAIDFLNRTHYCRHLEIETYTWLVIPEEVRNDLCGGTLLGSLEQEFRWTLERLED